MGIGWSLAESHDIDRIWIEAEDHRQEDHDEDLDCEEEQREYSKLMMEESLHDILEV